MTVQKKLVIANILMIFIPMVLSFFFAVVAFTPYGGGGYWDAVEDQMYEDENGLYSVQSIIYAYKRGALNENRGADVTRRYAMSINDMETDLSHMGYRFCLSKAGKEVFSNLTDLDKKQLGEYQDEFRDDIGNLTISTNGCFIVRDTFTVDDEDWEILAVHTAGQNDENIRRTPGFDYREYVMPAILFFVALVIAVVALTSLVLTKWIQRMILKPLELLKKGTKEISGGNLSYEFTYEKQDEFGDVCREFEQMREHLKASVEAGLAYERYRKELIAGISHDLRTPLTSIKGYVEGLKDGIANTEEKKNRYYDAISIRTKDMETLVDSLSEFARLENERYQYRMELVEVGEYLKRLVEGYQEEARRKGAVILFENLAKKEKAMLDIQEMQRVFINLFENSIRYRTKGESEISVSLESRKDALQISVKDDGPGVAEDKLPFIFDSFYRGDDSRTNSGNGSGLGLAIAKRIVEGHRGSIRAYNENGLVVEMLFPLEEKEQNTGGGTWEKSLS